jgi:hypothetical protein
MGLVEISRRKFVVTAGAVSGVSPLRPQALYGVPTSLLVPSETPGGVANIPESVSLSIEKINDPSWRREAVYAVFLLSLAA